MNCIQFHSPFLLLLLPVHRHLKYGHQRTTMTGHSFRHPTQSPKLAKHSQKMATMAVTNPFILGATSPGGDIKVLLPTSAVLVFAYIMANFVFPAFISKQFGFDKVDENPKPKKKTSSDDDDEEDDLDEDDDDE